jgi:hypothetical protein
MRSCCGRASAYMGGLGSSPSTEKTPPPIKKERKKEITSL